MGPVSVQKTDVLLLRGTMVEKNGIARRLDKMGRIVIPIEARRSLGWKDTTSIEISLFGNYILLHEYENESAAPVSPERFSPLQNEVGQAINKLSDQDTLRILNLLQRFAGLESDE